MRKGLIAVVIAICAGVVVSHDSLALAINEPYPVFDQEEITVLFESSERLSMDYGYDSYIESYCFYFISSDLSGMKSDKKNDTTPFAQYFEKKPKDMVWNLYVKLTGNIAALNYLDRYYTRKKVWKYVNYIRKTVLPGTVKYHKALEEYVLKNRDFSDKISNGANELKESKRAAILSQKKRLTIVDEYQ